jgi:hypothetical protein
MITYTKANGIYTFLKDDSPVLYFSCRDNVLTNKDGKALKGIAPAYWCTQENNTKLLQIAINNIVKNPDRKFYVKKFNVIESCLAYPDIATSFADLPSDFPKGFADYCKKNELNFSQYALDKFNLEKAMSRLPKDVVELLAVTEKASSHIKSKINELLNEKEIDFLVLTNKVFKTQLKENLWELDRIIDFIAIYLAGKKQYKNAILQMIDTNRTFSYNANQIKCNLEDLQNKDILNNEKQIAFLETVDFGDYIIKVPAQMADFTDEGNQQHNCVGYHYHNSIRRNENLVYFLRKKDNPTRSYITCRYNMQRSSTVEYLATCNSTVKDENAVKVIKEIDKLITEKMCVGA